MSYTASFEGYISESMNNGISAFRVNNDQISEMATFYGQ
jgi:hypothetical protein